MLQIKPQSPGIREDAALYRESVWTGRDARFRIEVVVLAYKHTCALWGYRMTTLEMESIVDAAHIHQFHDSRNNDPRNGIALSKNAHWQFDRGLWSLTNDYRVLVHREKFMEDGIAGQRLAVTQEDGEKLLASYAGKKVSHHQKLVMRDKDPPILFHHPS